MLCYTLLPDNYSSGDYEKLYLQICGKLPVFRRTKAENIIPPKDRAVSSLSFFLMCHALSAEYPYFSGLTLSDIGRAVRFTYSDNGKPSLAAPHDNIHFNISHCRNAIACAVAPFDIGVDIQDVRTPSPAALRRFFPASEFSEEPGADEFSMHWSRYEAYIKFTGEGITRSYADCDYLSDDFLIRSDTFLKSFTISNPTQKKTAAYLTAAFPSAYSESFLTTPLSVEFSRLCELVLL